MCSAAFFFSLKQHFANVHACSSLLDATDNRMQREVVAEVCTHEAFFSCCQGLELLCGTTGLAKRAQEFTALECIAQLENEVLERVA